MMAEKAKEIVMNYYNNRHMKLVTIEDVAIVWFCKTLQNYKALVITFTPDELYYEVTYDGDQERWYLDVYEKTCNVVVEE